MHTYTSLNNFTTLNLYSAGLHCALLAGISQKQMSSTYFFIFHIEIRFIFPFGHSFKYPQRKTSVCYKIFLSKKFVESFDCLAITLLSFLLQTNPISCIGVPDEVIKRAAFVLDAMENHKHVERLHNENLSAQDKLYQVFYDLKFSLCCYLCSLHYL